MLSELGRERTKGRWQGSYFFWGLRSARMSSHMGVKLINSDLPFLTLYDPYELPGGTIDPLGFQRGYLRLAEEWLPGLTNAADQPRYVSMLCRAALLADENTRDISSPRQRRRARIEIITRYERLWVAACTIVLGPQGTGSGLRGISYARDVVDSARIRVDYPFLGNQVRYGAIGIYAPMSGELGLLSDELTPTGLGARLGEAFPTNGQVEEVVADRNHGTIPREILEEWGKQTRIDRITPRERGLLKAALLDGGRRSIALQLIGDTPTGIEELARLRIIRAKLERNDRTVEVQGRILLLKAIDTFEGFYRISQYAFDRMRWLASSSPKREWSLSDHDDGLDKALPKAIELGGELLRDLANLKEVLEIAPHCESPIELAKATCESKDAGSWCKILTDHHLGVQRGKFEGTLPKAPWVERKGDSILVGANRYYLNDSPSSVNEMAAHPYRTSAADNFIRASGIGP
jgi:hypothetical protein